MYNSPISLTFTNIEFRTLEQFRKKAETLLEKEKQVIIDAFEVGYSFNHNISDPTAEQYYNETFNK